MLVDVLLHLDRQLSEVIQQYGMWTYLILFLIVFCETGLVVTPFLPGDSLLFAVGTFAALGALDLALVIGLLGVAAILGDSVNYAIGARLGPRVFHEESRFLNRRHLERTREFYERYGAKTIVIARGLDRDPGDGGLSLRQHPGGAAQLLARDLRDHRPLHPARPGRGGAPASARGSRRALTAARPAYFTAPAVSPET